MKRYGLAIGLLLGVSTIAWARHGLDTYGPGGDLTVGLTGPVDLMYGHEPKRGTPEWVEWWGQKHTPVPSVPLNPVVPNPTSYDAAVGRLSALMQVGGFPPSRMASLGLLHDARSGGSLHFLGRRSPSSQIQVVWGPGGPPQNSDQATMGAIPIQKQSSD